MRVAPVPTRPTFGPLRVVSDVLDEVEGDLESIQRDLVVAERVSGLVLAVAALAVAGVVALLVLWGVGRRHPAAPAVDEAADEPAAGADPGRSPTDGPDPRSPTDGPDPRSPTDGDAPTAPGR
jgi:hypothetical protein